jgi:hypothetical protein
MVAAANQCKVVNQVGFTFRHLYGIEEMQRRLKDRTCSTSLDCCSGRFRQFRPSSAQARGRGSTPTTSQLRGCSSCRVPSAVASLSRLTPAHQPNFVEVVGRTGALHAFISRGGFDTLRRSSGSEWHDIALPAEAGDGRFHALYRMMHAFVDGCLGGQLYPGGASFEDGLAAQRMIAAAEEAAQTRDWVSLSSGE